MSSTKFYTAIANTIEELERLINVSKNEADKTNYQAEKNERLDNAWHTYQDALSIILKEMNQAEPGQSHETKPRTTQNTSKAQTQ